MHLLTDHLLEDLNGCDDIYSYEQPQNISESSKSNYVAKVSYEIQILDPLLLEMEVAEIDQYVKGLKAVLTSTNEIVHSILKTQDLLQQSISTIISRLYRLDQLIIALIPVPQRPDPNPSTVQQSPSSHPVQQSQLSVSTTWQPSTSVQQSPSSLPTTWQPSVSVQLSPSSVPTTWQPSTPVQSVQSSLPTIISPAHAISYRQLAPVSQQFLEPTSDSASTSTGHVSCPTPLPVRNNSKIGKTILDSSEIDKTGLKSVVCYLL